MYHRATTWTDPADTLAQECARNILDNRENIKAKRSDSTITDDEMKVSCWVFQRVARDRSRSTVPSGADINIASSSGCVQFSVFGVSISSHLQLS